MNIPTLYKKLHVDKEHTSIGLFKKLKTTWCLKMELHLLVNKLW